MSKARNTGNLNNSIQISDTGAITFVSGSTTLLSVSTTGQLSGSAPVLSAATASFVALAQSASNAVSAQTASFANALTVAGTLTAQTLVVQTITSSVDFVTGSTRFGSISGNTHQFTGSVSVNGPLNVSNTVSTIPILCNIVNQEQYIFISSSVGREAMSRYYNATAGDWYAGIRANPGLTDTASYHIYSSTYGNDVLAITTGGTTVVRTLGVGVNPTQTAALTFADGVGTKILLNNNANNYRIDLVSNVAGGDAMMKFVAGLTIAGEFGFYTGTTLRQLITSDGRQVINSNASAITGYGTTVQSLLINGANGALTINSAGTGYAYMNFAQGGTSKIEIGINGSGTNDGSFYINTNIQTGASGASLWVQKSNGYVGIGRITADYTLDVGGDIRFGRFRGINSLSLSSYATVNPSSNVYLYTTPNDRDMWIMLDAADPGSNWGMYYRQIDSYIGSLPGNSVAYVGGGNNGLRAWICLANGDYYFGGANQSDARSKHNINYISYSAIDKVNALKPATFNYNENPDISKGGFIAQDVKEVLPEFVTNKDDEKHMMGVDYYGIIAVLTKAIQEQQAQIEELKAQING